VTVAPGLAPADAPGTRKDQKGLRIQDPEPSDLLSHVWAILGSNQ
jgi:hypothetical protein